MQDGMRSALKAQAVDEASAGNPGDIPIANIASCSATLINVTTLTKDHYDLVRNVRLGCAILRGNPPCCVNALTQVLP
jgi:hypothetical protein